MNDKEKIHSLINQLDETIPKEGACVRFDFYGGGPDESMILANSQGYLRLGIELLKAGISDTKQKDDKGIEDVVVNIDYLMSRNSPISFDMFQRDENLKIEQRVYQKQSWWIAPLVIGIILAILLFIITGVVTLFKWLF